MWQRNPNLSNRGWNFLSLQFPAYKKYIFCLKIRSQKIPLSNVEYVCVNPLSLERLLEFLICFQRYCIKFPFGKIYYFAEHILCVNFGCAERERVKLVDMPVIAPIPNPPFNGHSGQKYITPGEKFIEMSAQFIHFIFSDNPQNLYSIQGIVYHGGRRNLASSMNCCTTRTN